jgi:hypothetical protein
MVRRDGDVMAELEVRLHFGIEQGGSSSERQNERSLSKFKFKESNHEEPSVCFHRSR